MKKNNLVKTVAVTAQGVMALSATGMMAAAEDATYQVGICQLVQHPGTGRGNPGISGCH